STEDYRKHLGIISTIRKDFESLVERLKDMRQQLTNDLRPVERIVLYIDDLDRCPTTKVIEVLQAVHLLLAYPLFVVVVGVDPRWLLHSLDSNYSAFESEPETYSDDPALWRTTPQNFLEKIFQIPFTLRQMTDKGFGNLMEGLLMPMQPELTSNENESVETSNKTVSHPTSVPTEVENLPNQIRDFEKSSNVSAGEVKISPVEQGKRIVDLPPVYGEFKVNEESLTIRSWETNFASELFRIISTPRAAKRFANIYRILKASVQREDLANFEGSAELPGEFQLPMLLLAILTGTPSLASKIFPKLKEGATEGIGIKDSLEQADADDKKSGWNDLLRRDVLSIVERSWFPNDIRLLAAWLPKVSRFSFEVGRLV
ncbi:MAG TPA: P-loop NTPase fold protein, partial [Chitinophagaceae bacterium]|nr:P-loop NTPase fold protein [Chitinophagaceae bacterium]